MADSFSCLPLVAYCFNPIRSGWAVGGGQEVPALTSNVNNIFNIAENATKLYDFS